jgi:small subunit ribosomal protein S15
MIKKDKKQDIIKKLGKHDADTGSARVQVGLLTEQINQLAKHLKKNKKDNHSRRGLLQMVADRRSHLKYLQKKDKKGYEEIVKKLALK